MFTYCPKCQDALISDKYHYSCNNCGFDFYFNASPAAGVLIINKKGQVYLARRAREPRAGFWESPGGFINIKESAEEGARREIKEELGLDLGNLVYLGSYPNEYLYKGTQYYPLDIFFVSRVDLDKIKPIETGELSEGRFFDIEEIVFDDI